MKGQTYDSHRDWIRCKMVVHRYPARLVLMFLVGCGLAALYLKRLALISNLISIFKAPICRSNFLKSDGVRAIQGIWNKRGRVS